MNGWSGYNWMSITPVVETSEYDFRQEGSLNRQGSMGSSEEEQASGQGEGLPAAPGKEKGTGFARHLVQNVYFQVFVTLLTVVTLVLYDVKTIAFGKEQDLAFGVANCIFCAVFLAEIALNVSTEGYFCSFFFYLDLVSTITILFDVDFLTDAMFGHTSGFSVSGFVAKSKASRVAARAVRVVKIFRLARVAKLYKSTQRAKELTEKDRLLILEREASRVRGKESNELELPANDEPSNHNLASRSCITRNHHTATNLERYDENDSIKQDAPPAREEPEPEEEPAEADMAGRAGEEGRESQISKILTEDTIKKIVIIILLIMVEIPLLSINNFENISTQWDLTAATVADGLLTPDIPLSSLLELLKLQEAGLADTGTSASFVCVDSPFLEISTCAGVNFDDFRSADLGVFSSPVDSAAVLVLRPTLTAQTVMNSLNAGDAVTIFVDYSEYNSIDAGFSIATTTFICLTIIYLLGSFSSGINELVIVPIERMLALVRARGEAEREEEEAGGEEYETRLVQRAIVRIKDLMETIYGPLGNDLVQEKFLNHRPITANLTDNLRHALTVAATCRINHFTKITDLLAEDAFGLINEIALIVHNAAFRYGGYCTKVLDQGFLIVFKVPQEEVKRWGLTQGAPVDGLGAQAQSYLNTFCDFSVFFALKALARMVKEPKLFKYRNDQRLLRGFGGVFNIEMNFALTMGWLSEAVVGSTHKIDPLFLGPELRTLERLVRLSQNYPSSVLLTASLHSRLSPGLRAHIRPFDVLQLEQTAPAARVYFVDYDATNVTPSANVAEKRKEARDLRTKKAMNMLYLSGLLRGDKAYNATTFISRKKELLQILRKTTADEARRKRYEGSFEKYVRGEWPDCQEFLESDTLKNDIPAQRLCAFLQAHAFKAPPHWPGSRLYADLFEP